MQKIGLAVFGIALLAPSVAPTVRAESSSHERKESTDTKRKEEDKAHQKYLNAVSKHGENSPQAQKAKRHWEHEKQEHGNATP